MEDLNLVLRERLQKAEQIERDGIPLYPNGYQVPDRIQDIVQAYS